METQFSRILAGGRTDGSLDFIKGESVLPGERPGQVGRYAGEMKPEGIGEGVDSRRQRGVRIPFLVAAFTPVFSVCLISEGCLKQRPDSSLFCS